MSGFRTKLDFSDNRQAKQRPITRTVLSGGTSFGLPYNLLPSGPNLATSAITENYTYIASTFSGNNTTTVYNWSDPRMQLGVSSLSALTSSTSGLTQNTGAVWTANTTTVIDGNTVALTYSGVNFDISVVTIAQLTPSTYSGTITTNNFEVYTASTLDYTGRTIWVDVSGITRTEKLIITKNPQVGYTWTCIDLEGNGEWQYNGSSSGSTIWTAGTGANSAVLGGSNGIASGSNSVAEGSGTTAIGSSSHAEGNITVASGTSSHSEGYQTQANGYASHAEGGNTLASGNYSHAEGFGDSMGLTESRGSGSHAEGNATLASGDYSHAEGQLTTASGDYSHAEGFKTVSIGYGSHAEGNNTTAKSDYSHAGGYGVYAHGDYSFAHFFGDPFDINLGVSGYSSAILGGEYHSISYGSDDSAIIGGFYNKISGNSINSGIFVGTANTISNNSKHAAIIAGMNNTISGHSNSVIVGGSSNLIDFCLNNYYSAANEAIIGGGSNKIFGTFNCVIIGGSANILDGRPAGIGSTDSFIIGSYGSSAYTSNSSGILGGTFNSIKPSDCSYVSNSIIIGGYRNEYNPSIGAGTGSGERVTIIGGFQNKVTGPGVSDGSIFGGRDNLYESNIGNGGEGNTIVGGSGNTMISKSTYFGQDMSYISILGGAGNIISSDISPTVIYDLSSYSNISGGFKNTITGSSHSFIGGGLDNIIKKGATSSVILGGELNTIENATGWYGNNISSAIIAGSGNTISGHYNSAILAGAGNTIHFDLMGSESKVGEVIIGGYYNTISASSHSLILGGQNNQITNYDSSGILGGNRNRLIDLTLDTYYGPIDYNSGNNDETKYSTIIGGVDNSMSGKTSHCAILGGSGNTINGNFATGTNYDSAIIGGLRNVINQYVSRSVILGGSDITATTSDHVYVPNIIINTGGTSSSLGINTNSPTERIHVVSTLSSKIRLDADINNSDETATAQLLMTQDGGGSTANIGLSPDTNNDLMIGVNSGGGTTPDIRFNTRSDGTVFTTTADTKMILKNDGKLGINIDSPDYLIDAMGTGNRLYYSSAGVGSLNISATTGLPSLGVVAGTSNSANQLTAVSMGVRAWDDNIYTVYGYKGDAFIYAGIYTNGLNIISNDGSTSGTGADYIRFYAGQSGGGGATNNPDLHIQGSGSSRGFVAINVPYNQDPTQRLDVNGNARFRSIGSSASAGALHYTSDGTLTTNTSDERLKTNIVTLTNALEQVKQLRGVKYNWIEEPNGDVRIGLIAQEVNSVVPELTFVNKNTEEQYMGVHYDNVVALLIEAVKELSSGSTIANNTYLETQTILAEDNNIELNYNGTQETSLGGGLKVLHAKGQDLSADLITDENGDFVTNNDFKPNALTIPLYTPTSSNDAAGKEGNITRDDNYLYVKTSSGWKRTNLESF